MILESLVIKDLNETVLTETDALTWTYSTTPNNGYISECDGVYIVGGD